MSMIIWYSRIIVSSVMSLLLLSACGVEIKAVRVNAEQLKNREFTDPGIYYYLPRTRLQLSLPVDYHRELVDRSDTQLGTCLAETAATCSGWDAPGSKLARCQLLEKRERFVIHSPTIKSYAVPDFNQLYRVEAKPLTPFQGVSHTVTFSAESPGVMTSSVAEGSDKSVEVLAALVKTAIVMGTLRVAPGQTKPPPIEWDESLIPCSDIRRLQDLHSQLSKMNQDITIPEAIAALAKLKDEKYWGEEAEGVQKGAGAVEFKAPLAALEKYMEQRQAGVTALTAEIAAIKVRNGIVSSTPKVSLAIPLAAAGKLDEDYLEPGDYCNFEGKLMPASLKTESESFATRLSLESVATRQLTCRFENDPKDCLCKTPRVLPDSVCNDKESTIAPLEIHASIESTGPDQNATQEESDAVGGYRYRIPIPARVKVHLLTKKSPEQHEKIPLKDQLVEIAQYGPVARLPHRFSGQKAGVELTLNAAGSPTRLKIGSEPAQTEPVTGLLDSVSARAEQRRKERKEDEAKAAETARKSEFEDLKLEADTLEQQIRLDKLRSGQAPE